MFCVTLRTNTLVWEWNFCLKETLDILMKIPSVSSHFEVHLDLPIIALTS